MSSNIPSYLRLHTGDSDPPPEQPDELAELAGALQSAIGWSVQAGSGRESDDRDPQPPLELQQPCGPAPVSHSQASTLIAALNPLCLELQRTRRALWEREAELAAAVPVTPRPDEEAHLAERLEAILRGGAEALGCQAAALYLLNDDTSELKIRASWGLPEERLLEPARPLRGAAADLEALVGHAVVLEDAELLPHWKVPEDFPSAVCVPISSPTAPLGTLWVFSRTRRDFTEEQTNLIEIVAGRLAADLDREVLMHEGLSGQALRLQRDRMATAQFDRMPRIAPLLDGWQVSGWTVPADDLSGDFYDWTILPDGQLAVALGDAMGQGLESAVTALNLQTALKAHGCYRHDARQMVARLNETLWTSSAGDQFAALFYVLLDPDTGQLQYCVAGKCALVLSNAAVPVIGDSLPLGTQPDDTYTLVRDRLPPEGVILMVSEGLLPLAERSGRRRSPLAQLLKDMPHAPAEDIAEAVRSLMLARLDRVHKDSTVLVVKRENT